MKMYTNESQTAKLIELGVEKPKSEVRSERGPFSSDARKAYSIGELIEMLPPIIVWKRKNLASTIARTTFNSFVSYAELDGTPYIVENSTELIDALYNMIIKLKEE